MVLDERMNGQTRRPKGQRCAPTQVRRHLCS
jgi:hypothetical protein